MKTASATKIAAQFNDRLDVVVCQKANGIKES